MSEGVTGYLTTDGPVEPATLEVVEPKKKPPTKSELYAWATVSQIKREEREAEAEEKPAERIKGSGRRPLRSFEPVRKNPKYRRNEVCPCGSGRKFKHCHEKDVRQ